MNSLRNTSMRKLRVIALPLILSGFLSACLGGDGDTTTSAVTDTIPPATDTTTPPSQQSDAERSAVLLWNQPTTNTDGSLLTDLQGYNIYHGTAANDLKKVAEVAVNQMNYTATGLSQGTHYFAVSAYNRDRVESALSNVGSKTFDY